MFNTSISITGIKLSLGSV